MDATSRRDERSSGRATHARDLAYPVPEHALQFAAL